MCRPVGVSASCDGPALLRQRLPRVELRNVLHRLCALFISNESGLPCKTDLISGVWSNQWFSLSRCVTHNETESYRECKRAANNFVTHFNVSRSRQRKSNNSQTQRLGDKSTTQNATICCFLLKTENLYGWHKPSVSF